MRLFVYHRGSDGCPLSDNFCYLSSYPHDAAEWLPYRPLLGLVPFRCAKELRLGELLLLIPVALSFISQLALSISLIVVFIILLAVYFPPPAKG